MCVYDRNTERETVMKKQRERDREREKNTKKRKDGEGGRLLVVKSLEEKLKN